jgi:chemotaxis family two-component system response regulator Rcp1
MNRSQAIRMFDVLLIEDNAGDVRLIKETWAEDKMISLHVVKDGEKALAFLRRKGRYAEAPHPDLILLDLNLPRKNGHEVLAEIKTDDILKRTPVVVITASHAEQDIHKCYDLNANCFVTKPMNLDQFLAVLKAVKEFWLGTVELPSDGAR